MNWPWSELGLDGPASLEEVRRAYARRVKEVHPEEDPEGFQRLHTAYQEARQAARKAERAARRPPEFTGGLEMETGRPPQPESGTEDSGLDFPALLNQEKSESQQEEQRLDFSALLRQGEPPRETQEKQEEQEHWDFQRLLFEEERRQAEERQRQYGGGEHGGAVDRALQLVRLLLEEKRPRSDWERFLLSGLFFQVKKDPQFMAGLAEAFRAGPVQNPKIREDVLRAYGFKAENPPKTYRAFCSAVSGREEETWTTRRRRFRQRHPRLFRAVILADGLLLLLLALRLWGHFTELSDRQQAQTICQYIEEDVGYPVESRYDGSDDSACLFYLPEQKLTFTARPEGERDLSQGQLGYETDLANFLLSLELKDFAEEWNGVCQLEIRDGEGNSVGPGRVPRTYRISTGPWDGADCVAALGSLMDSLSQETWYRRLVPTYQLQLLVENCVYYTYNAPEEPLEAGTLLDYYETKARPALLYFMLEKSGLRKADFGSTPYQLVDLGVVTLYLDDFIQFGGVDKTTGETTRLYFYNNLYLISTPAQGFDPHMDAFAYMDFIYTDQFEEGTEKLTDGDFWLLDVIRH